SCSSPCISSVLVSGYKSSSKNSCRSSVPSGSGHRELIISQQSSTKELSGFGLLCSSFIRDKTVLAFITPSANSSHLREMYACNSGSGKTSNTSNQSDPAITARYALDSPLTSSCCCI